MHPDRKQEVSAESTTWTTALMDQLEQISQHMQALGLRIRKLEEFYGITESQPSQPQPKVFRPNPIIAEVGTSFRERGWWNRYELTTAFAIPFSLLAIVILYADFPLSETRPWPKEEVPRLGWAEPLDFVYRHYGPLIPLIVLVVRLLYIPYDKLIKEDDLEEDHDTWGLPRGWLSATLVIWLGVTIARMLLYLITKEWNDYFSDHIFLATCLCAMISTELFIVHLTLWKAKTRHTWHHWVPFAVAWLMQIFIMFESYVTVRYWHTRFSCWLAYIVGTSLFAGGGLWWSHVFQRRMKQTSTSSMSKSLLAGV